MPGGRAGSRGNEDRAELVAVQRGGVRLAVDPSLQDTGGRGALQEFFADRVLARTRREISWWSVVHCADSRPDRLDDVHVDDSRVRACLKAERGIRSEAPVRPVPA